MKRRKFLTSLGILGVSAIIPKFLYTNADLERREWSACAPQLAEFYKAGALDQPYDYYTGNVELDPPDLSVWKVERGFPRKVTGGTFSCNQDIEIKGRFFKANSPIPYDI